MSRETSPLDSAVLSLTQMDTGGKDKTAHPTVTMTRQGGDDDPTKLYEFGPRTWPSLALRAESDQVFESSGIIGWCVCGPAPLLAA